MLSVYTALALDLARERAAQAAFDRQVDEVRRTTVQRPSLARRSLAHVLAAVSRGSAAVTRRLDDCVADDLVRSLAAE